MAPCFNAPQHEPCPCARCRVTRGADLLATRPSYAASIDRGSLDMASVTSSVAGQIGGYDLTGFELLGLTEAEAVPLGLAAAADDYDDPEYAELTAAWVEVLTGLLTGGRKAAA